MVIYIDDGGLEYTLTDAPERAVRIGSEHAPYVAVEIVENGFYAGQLVVLTEEQERQLDRRLNAPAVLRDLVDRVLQRPDAEQALEYILSESEEGPSCGCGANHWSCDFDPDAEPEDEP